MIITHIKTEPQRIPLKKPFVTARRTAAHMESVLVAVYTDDGEVGYGEAAAVAAVTGETGASVMEAVSRYIAPALTGLSANETTPLSLRIQDALHGNPAAKSAVECAVYDVWARSFHTPLFRLLGGVQTVLHNNITISANTPEEMAADCMSAVREGHRHIKIKLGKTPDDDGRTLIRLWDALREQDLADDINFRVDANQGWTTKTAIRHIHLWERAGMPVEWVEQPVPAWDIDGLRAVTAHTETVITADESIFSPQDAARLLAAHATDMINIKLAKAGGIRNALTIASLCEAYGIPCMLGCMLESRLGVSAAAHIAAAHPNIVKTDLDGPLLCAADPFNGGPVFDGARIYLTEDEGIGARPVNPL